MDAELLKYFIKLVYHFNSSSFAKFTTNDSDLILEPNRFKELTFYTFIIDIFDVTDEEYINYTDLIIRRENSYYFVTDHQVVPSLLCNIPINSKYINISIPIIIDNNNLTCVKINLIYEILKAYRTIQRHNIILATKEYCLDVIFVFDRNTHFDIKDKLECLNSIYSFNSNTSIRFFEYVIRDNAQENSRVNTISIDSMPNIEMTTRTKIDKAQIREWTKEVNEKFKKAFPLINDGSNTRDDPLNPMTLMKRTSMDDNHLREYKSSHDLRVNDMPENAIVLNENRERNENVARDMNLNLLSGNTTTDDTKKLQVDNVFSMSYFNRMNVVQENSNSHGFSISNKDVNKSSKTYP